MFSSVFLCALSTAVGVLAVDVPTSPYCNDTDGCADSFAIGYEFDYNFWVDKDLDADSFWTVPNNTNATSAGDIIKWQDLSSEEVYYNWTIPGGMTLSRFLYMTEDVDGSLLPASAFVLLPYKPPNNQTQLRTVVWAHGTAGYARICAPSNHKNLYYDWSAPYSFAQAGYAVIAPDYTGLGTDIPQRFMYLAGYSHAADVAFSLIAARKKLGDILTDEWVTIGQSEGGMTAWRTNERLAMADQDALLAAGTFLGSVAIAPALRPLDMIDDAVSDPDDDNSSAGVGIYILESLAGLYPDEIQLSDYLTETALGRVELADQCCVYGAFYLYYSLNASQTYSNYSWTSTPAAQDWRQRYMKQGPYPLAAPMLVIQGDADTLVPVNFTKEDYERTCTQYPGSSVQLNIYSGQDHDVVTTSSQPDYLGWVKDRFDGVVASTTCSMSEFGPLFDNFNIYATVYEAAQ